MQRPKKEFRQHQRKNLSVPVSLHFADESITTHTVNISSTGIALSRPHNTNIAPHQNVTVRFTQARTRNLRARVIHVDEQKIGISFENPINESSAITAQSINNNASKRTAREKPRSPYSHMRRWVKQQTRRAAILLVNTPMQPVIIDWVKPKFLFAAYGTRKEANVYFTPWMERLLPQTLICGLIRADGRTGFMVASTHLEDALYHEGEKTRSYLQDLARRFPSAHRIALVGRLPNFAKKAGIHIKPPFVDGTMGTRYMILDAALKMRTLPPYHHETGITVLGGAGRIGDQVCNDLLGPFTDVIAFDPRYTHEETTVTERGRLIRTANIERLKTHKLFIGLTHHGDAIRPLAEHLPPGSLIADDTHPCISAETRELLTQRGIDTLKIVLTHNRFSMTPRMPAWNSQDIPGCLVEALVLLENQDCCVKDFSRFASAAENAGFCGNLVPPPAY